MNLLLVLLALAVLASPAESGWLVERLVGADYPLLAQQARIEGAVELACRVDPHGRVSDCRSVSGHPLLRSTAIENAGKWRWRRNSAGDPRVSTVKIRYEFKLIGSGVRSRPKVEFSFEFPNIARVVSEIPCADHAPCPADE